ncbi:MAG: FAD-dependent thymidylate synthase, partial [Bdellovibrio sp.]
KIEEELRKIMPTFVKRASGEHGIAWSNYLRKVEQVKEAFPKGESGFAKRVDLVRVNGSEEDILAMTIVSSSNMTYEEAKKIAYSMPPGEKESFFENFFSIRENRRHKPPREFEEVRYTFEIVTNFGAYRDLQRHRMLTQFRQPLTPKLGYDVPQEIVDAGFEYKWERAMERARKLYEKMAKTNGHYAQYVLPFAYRARFFFTLTLREAFHLCELRSQPQGHPDYRSIAIAIADEIAKVHPNAGKMLFLNRDNISLERYEAEKRLENKRRIIHSRT